MLDIMVQANILQPAQVVAFNLLGINSIEGFRNWLNGLPENQRWPAITVFTDFIRNPYWGMLLLVHPTKLAVNWLYINLTTISLPSRVLWIALQETLN